MTTTMSLAARREMLLSIRQRYLAAKRPEKTKILDGFVAATGYDRKYALVLLCKKSTSIDIVSLKPKSRPGAQVYDDQFRHVLIKVWNTANQVCSKRFVPFIPDLVAAMERHGHLRISDDIRKKLMKVSAATVDRILQPERSRQVQGLSQTKAGALLKSKIQVRTFADWNDIVPGFYEVDLVAHCGDDANGTFLNSLVMVDVSTGWLECMPLLRKSAADVINGVSVARSLMPFPLLGLDTDGGSEFINYEVLDYCESNKITFTRSRAYKKNDQAFVEEKNGSVVRRLVGYDRFEGPKAWAALAKFYSVLRKYVNFFQPSVKLLKKTRTGAKVAKQYDKALTPYQRILNSPHVQQDFKDDLTAMYLQLDPVTLMSELKLLQNNLMTFAWNINGTAKTEQQTDKPAELHQSHTAPTESEVLDYFRFEKPKDKRSLPRTWRTRKDPFEHAWDDIKFKLQLEPHCTAPEIIEWLSVRYPGRHDMGQVRTLQRRISALRLRDQTYQAKLTELMQEE